MKITRAGVKDFVASKGYTAVQIDGIPEGFSFKKPDITIANVLHVGDYVAFIPLENWENESVVHANSPEDLLKVYNSKKYGK